MWMLGSCTTWAIPPTRVFHCIITPDPSRCYLPVFLSLQVLQHQTLVMEVIQQLQRMFKPDLKLIKKRIEDLIQREYLERDKDNPTLFKYLA